MNEVELEQRANELILSEQVQVEEQVCWVDWMDGLTNSNPCMEDMNWLHEWIKVVEKSDKKKIERMSIRDGRGMRREGGEGESNDREWAAISWRS